MDAENKPYNYAKVEFAQEKAKKLKEAVEIICNNMVESVELLRLTEIALHRLDDKCKDLEERIKILESKK